MLKIDTEKEKTEILNAYRGLLRACKRVRNREDTRMIRKAFDVALEAHKDMRRKSGEPYIYHPIAVARIAAEEIGLGATSIVCALLHDTVEDTYITLEDIEGMFGKKVAKIIDGLTKISGVFDQKTSLQAENFRKMLLTMSEDVRVILIKLADRLHNMRTLDSMKREKQLKIASETAFLYAPLAHRLGLYSIKTELEDLSLKFKEPQVYQDIQKKLKKTEAVRNRFISRFSLPIRNQLESEGYKFIVKARTKSVFSIWNKIQKKNIPFEEIYDVFAIRIILESASDKEKSDVWKVYSMVTDFYQPNPDRLRDWISIPKANGYESLHTTVMSPTGKWVEVQIRSKRMDEIAEKGYAAHWKYKQALNTEGSLDIWLAKIRESLNNTESNALDFIDDFKLNLFSDEIFIFTPNGDLKTLPQGATALDFAYEIHSQVGAHCIGAKVNQKLIPLSHPLKSGDQAEIITSSKQSPKEGWLDYVITAKARSNIKSALKEEKKKIASVGREIVQRKFNQLKVKFTSKNVNQLEFHYSIDSAIELYYRIAKGSIDLKKLKGYEVVNSNISFPQIKSIVPAVEKPTIVTTAIDKDDTIILGDDLKRIDYKLAPCCNPLPGDDVFGFLSINDGIKIHRTNCPNATQMMSNYAYRILKAKWKSQEFSEFLAGVRFTGIDDLGLVNKVTSIISKELHVNIKSISFESNDGVFEGTIMVNVHDKAHLTELMEDLRKIDEVATVERLDTTS